jgi:hypothetical protein
MSVPMTVGAQGDTAPNAITPSDTEDVVNIEKPREVSALATRTALTSSSGSD